MKQNQKNIIYEFFNSLCTEIDVEIENYTK